MALKYKMLADSLKEEIRTRARRGERRLPTEAELMELHGVSRQTVRQALSLLHEDGWIEKRQGSGTYISEVMFPRSGHVQNIAVITPSENDHMFPTLMWEMQSVFSAAGYTAQVFSTGDSVAKEREILLDILKNPYCGILVEGTKNALPNPNLDLYQQLYDRGIPVIFLGHPYASLSQFSSVCADDYSGGFLLTQYLILKGHQKIGGIFCSDEQMGHKRYYGSICAMRDYNLSFHDSQFLWYDTRSRTQLSDPIDRETLLAFIDGPLRSCTAVICQNDEIACFLIRELQRLHIHVPDQISVVGFDNSYFSEISPVRITTASYKEAKPWEAAAHGLLSLMEGKNFSAISYPWTLIYKDSVSERTD